MSVAAHSQHPIATTLANFALHLGLLAGQSSAVSIRILCVLLSLAAMGLLYLARVRYTTNRAQERIIDALTQREQAARQLNDNLLQAFQALILRFHLAVDHLDQMNQIDPVERNNPARQMLYEALQSSDQVLAEGRERVIDLQSPDSGVDELSTALVAVAEELQKSSPSRYRVIIDGRVRELQPILRDEAYRIGREALTNAFRHAKASQIEIEISYQRSELRLRFRDNGSGIEPSCLKNNRQSDSLQSDSRAHHWGLPGMQARALRIGAHFDVWSRLNAGTEIELRIPSRLAYTTGETGLSTRKLRDLIPGRKSGWKGKERSA
jgi:signal transduction histidine kinase